MIDNKGWILRNVIIWRKYVEPSAATDFIIDHEYVYFFVKSQKYYFKTQYEPHNPKYASRYNYAFGGEDNKNAQGAFNLKKKRMIKPNPLGRRKRSVWHISTTGLIRQIIDAGCPEKGIVLMPSLRTLIKYIGN
jgi:hypothetical protein